MNQSDTGYKTITAQNTFTDTVAIKPGKFNLSIIFAPAAVATVTVQRSEDGATWRDLPDGPYTTSTERVGFSGANEFYRAGVKTGDFTSGSIQVRLYQA